MVNISGSPCTQAEGYFIINKKDASLSHLRFVIYTICKSSGEMGHIEDIR